MCYGDPDWGTDGYMRRLMEEDRRQQEYEEQEQEWTEDRSETK